MPFFNEWCFVADFRGWISIWKICFISYILYISYIICFVTSFWGWISISRMQLEGRWDKVSSPLIFQRIDEKSWNSWNRINRWNDKNYGKIKNYFYLNFTMIPNQKSAGGWKVVLDLYEGRPPSLPRLAPGGDISTFRWPLYSFLMI